jgi:hypothetical protein
MRYIAAEDYEILIVECRRLWNGFDPINMRSHGPHIQDEYDRYLSPTLSRLFEGWDTRQLAEFLRQIVEDGMELRAAPHSHFLTVALRFRTELLPIMQALITDDEVS